jgi:hypothetical protein
VARKSYRLRRRSDMGNGSPPASPAELRFFRGLFVAVGLSVVGWGMLAGLGYGVYLLAT